MSRARLIYDEAHAAVETGQQLYDPNVGVEGYYRHKMTSGGIEVAIRIWYGPPREPWTDEELDRAPCWNAQMNGKWIDFYRVWPFCAGEPISERDAKYLATLQQWGAKNGHEAMADPTKKLSPLTSPILF